MRIRRAGTPELTDADIEATKALMTAAFAEDEHGGFTEEDWQHALGGTHFLLEDRDGDGDAGTLRIVGHASVVLRDIHIGHRPFRTGYVEAVAIEPARQRRGLGSSLMRAVNEHVDEAFELGVLGTGSQPFYERLGWATWRGHAFVRTDRGDLPTPDEDGYLMVRRTPASPAIVDTDPISCEWRPGDVW